MLELKLFGRFEATVDESPLRRLRTHRGQAVLAYLALAAGKPVDRAVLASTVWPFSDPSDALYSLRRTLTDLRQALGTSASALVSPSSATLMLDPERADIDVQRFRKLAEEKDGACNAAELYRGELLEGWNEEWVPAHRAHFAVLLRECLMNSVRSSDRTGNPRRAADALQRLLDHEPHNEELLRMTMDRLALAGEPAVAWALYESFRKKLEADLGFAVSEETLRTAETIRERASSMRSAPSAPVRGFIAPFETSLVGRSDEIPLVADLLKTKGLVTLLGLGGIGKTRLAVEVARKVEAGFDSGAWMVPLAAVREPREVGLALAAALRPLDPQPHGPVTELAMRLSHISAVVLVDNCEHVLEPVREACRQFRAHCPGIRLLATSQHPIGVDSETIYPVPVLKVGRDRTGSSDSIQLFCERAANANAGFELNAEARAAIERICNRLEGIPLAIELAASRIRYVDAIRLDELLGERLELLDAPSASRDPRHSTLDATLAWSFDHLDEGERQTLMAAASFAGSWSVDDLAKLCCDGSTLTAVRLLESLVNRSLVIEAGTGGRPRFRLLDPVRRFAARKAAELGLSESLLGRHSDIVLAICTECSTGSSAGRPAESQATMAEIDDEISAAFSRAEQLGQTELALRLTATTWTYLWNRGWLQLGRARSERALLLPNAETFGKLYWDTLHITGLFAWSQAEYELARERVSAALEGYRLVEDDEGIGRATANLGQVLRNQGRTHEAEVQLRQVIEVWARLGHVNRLSLAHCDLAISAVEQCRFEDALPLFDAAAAIATEHSLEGPWVNIELNRGQAFHELGRFQEAEAAFDRGKVKTEQQNVFVMQLMVEHFRAFMRIRQGKLRAAAEAFAEGIEKFGQVGEVRGVAVNVEALGLVACEAGEFQDGALLLGAAGAIRSSLGIIRTPIEDLRCQRHTTTARLDDSEAFSRAMEIGAAFSRDQVSELARSLVLRIPTECVELAGSSA